MDWQICFEAQVLRKIFPGRKNCAAATVLRLNVWAVLVVLCGASPAGAFNPQTPSDVVAGKRPTMVILSAPWCQWCRVLEADVLPNLAVRKALRRYRVAHVDVDQHPEWMDLPGVQGLPSLVFFDRRGRHILTRSGYRSVPDLVDILAVVGDDDAAGRTSPYERRPMRKWSDRPLTADEAKEELQRLRDALWVASDSNLGAFGGPHHAPHPEQMLELAGLRSDPVIAKWLSLTVENALRGSSPRLRGDPAADMDFTVDELRALSRMGAKEKRWREGIERLPAADAYLGLQDPWDAGIFRYAAGPGWYHPHFERLAEDNLAWVLVLEVLGRKPDASRVHAYIDSTFDRQGLLDTSQASDPFYFRLTGGERMGLDPPKVTPLWTLAVQARAARVYPERCALLDRADTGRWPRAHWTRTGEETASPEALPDAIGELLLAWSSCPGGAQKAAHLAELVIVRWRDGLPATGRLHRLAAGICAANPKNCPRALATVRGIPLELEHAPPLHALRALAR